MDTIWFQEDESQVSDLTDTKKKVKLNLSNLPLAQLSYDNIAVVLRFLTWRDVLNFQSVSKEFRNIIFDRSILIKKYDEIIDRLPKTCTKVYAKVCSIVDNELCKDCYSKYEFGFGVPYIPNIENNTKRRLGIYYYNKNHFMIEAEYQNRNYFSRKQIKSMQSSNINIPTLIVKYEKKQQKQKLNVFGIEIFEIFKCPSTKAIENRSKHSSNINCHCRVKDNVGILSLTQNEQILNLTVNPFLLKRRKCKIFS